MFNSDLLEILSRITPEEEEILKSHEVDLNNYTDSQTKVFDANKLLKSGKLIQIRPHTRFVHFPKHTHNYIEIIYMCKGSTTHIVNGEEIVLNEGELLFLNQNAVQEIEPAGKDDIAVNFIVVPAFFDRALQMMDVEDNPIRNFLIGCMLGRDDDRTGFLHFKVSDVLPVQNLVENLIWSLVNELSGKRSINQITMGLLILQLMNQTEKVRVGENNTDSEKMLRVYRYIDENYKDGELTELSNLLKVSDYWLSRFIKKKTGKTYTQLVQEKRLSQSCYLLKNTSLSVSDICDLVGYENTSYFYRLFKKEMGCFPKEFRKEA